jgi:ribosomal protein L12E/L44/L45/RPP1/RPP2
MIEFKGFDDWISIFRGGKQKDSMGREHDGNALIDKAVANFNAVVHEPPAVIGHPQDNAPAYGWVDGLKKQGDLLMAKFKQVEPAFADMVRKGLFKKRSAAFYPDGTLRHVGFLGAMPPAVKGLPDVAFAEGDAAVFEFSERAPWYALGDVVRRLREWFIEKEGLEKADQVIPNWQVENIQAASQAAENETTSSIYQEKEDKGMDFKELIQKMKDLLASAAPAASGTFSEADLEAAKQKAADEAARKEREKVAAEFAERDRVARQDARKKEIAVWCDSMVKDGRLTPAMVKFGVPEMLLAFAEKEDVIEFGEAKEKATLFDRFKTLWEKEIPRVVTFGEVATRRKDAGDQGKAAEKVEALIQDKRKANKDLGYAAAFAEVQKENPDLAREYQQEIGG